MTKTVSIIVPVYNEEENILPFYSRLINVIDKIEKYQFEIIFTDNHSTDNTSELIKEICLMDKRVRYIRFSKNFGFQKSIYTGYISANGDAAIQLDCDLQDPPEMIRSFIAFWENGYQVVYGVRIARKESWLMNSARKVFYRVANFLSNGELPVDAGDFRLVDRVVLDVLKQIDDQQPYLRGLIATMGFRQIGIEYKREERKYGKSNFSWSDLAALAIDGILNHSIIPLRIATYTGISVSVLTIIGVIYYGLQKIYFGKLWPSGFATTTILILLSLSINALFLGIIGEYLGRIYQQVKKRPITIIESEINNEKPNTSKG